MPAWFGNEHHPQHENPVVGTAQVLLTCGDLVRLDSELALRAARWLMTAQHSNGGWGPPAHRLDYSGTYKDGFRAWRANDELAKFCSIEETALPFPLCCLWPKPPRCFLVQFASGLAWLAGAVEQDTHRQGGGHRFLFRQIVVS